jgi:FG-GAP repeat
MSDHSTSLRDGSDSFFDEPEDELIVQSGFSSHHDEESDFIEEDDGSAYHNEEEEYYSDEYQENNEDDSGLYEDDGEYNDDEYADEADGPQYSDEHVDPSDEEYDDGGSYSATDEDASQRTSQPNSSEKSYRDDPYGDEEEGAGHSPEHSPILEHPVYHSPGFPQSQDDGRGLRGEHYVSSDDGGASYEDIVLYGDGSKGEGSGSYDDDHHSNGQDYHKYEEEEAGPLHDEEEAYGSEVDSYKSGGKDDDPSYRSNDDEQYDAHDASDSATYNNDGDHPEYGLDERYTDENGAYADDEAVDEGSQQSYHSQFEEGDDASYASGDEPIEYGPPDDEDYHHQDADDASQNGDYPIDIQDGFQSSYDSQFDAAENEEYRNDYNDGSQQSYDSQFAEEGENVDYPIEADNGSQQSYDSQIDEEHDEFRNDATQKSCDSQFTEEEITDDSQKSYDSQREGGDGSYASGRENAPYAEHAPFKADDNYPDHVKEPYLNPASPNTEDAANIEYAFKKEIEPQDDLDSSSVHSVDASIDVDYEELPRGVDEELDVASYLSLRSDFLKDSGRSSSQGSVTNANAFPNLAVESDYSGYSNKQTILQSNQNARTRSKEAKSLQNSVPTKTTPNPVDLQISSNSLSNLSNSNENEFAIKGDTAFVVNNTNRGVGMEPRFFFSTHRNVSNEFSVDDLSLGTQMYSEHVEEGLVRENELANPEKTNSYYQPDLSRDISLLLKASNHSQAQTELHGSNGSQTKFDLNSSNHASAKFTPTEDSLGKRYSFVGSDFGSSFSETEDDGIHLDLSSSTKESNEMKSLKEEELIKVLEDEDKEYSVVRALAKEITTNHPVRSASVSPSLPSDSSDNNKTKGDAARSEPGYKLRAYDTLISPQQKQKLVGVGLSRKDSVDSYPISLGNDEKSFKSNTTNDEQSNGEDSRRATQSDGNGSDYSESPEQRDQGKYWTAVPDEAYQEARTRASAPNLGVFQHIPPSKFRHRMPATSTPATTASSPKTSNNWKEAHRKTATGHPPTTMATPEDHDIQDLEAGISKTDEREQSARKGAIRKKRPRWMYGIAGAFLLFIFMLMIVLLRKKNDNSQDVALSPTRSPSIPTAPVASTEVAPSIPPSTDTSNSQLIPFILQETLSGEGGFGASVAISGGMIVIGAPEAATVQSFHQINSNTSEWTESSNVTGMEWNSQFGQSIDLETNRLLVGAPLLYAPDGSTNSVGGVYAFIFDTVILSWQQIGATLQGKSDVSGEEFGAAVATSNAFRVVVGAPKNSRNNAQAGRVYTYEYQASFLSWVSSEVFPLVGEKAGDQFGASVDISQDGNHFIAGAPGTNGPGYARLYYWLDTKWQLLEVLRGQDSNEAFGSSVLVLSMNGDYVAVGGPGFANRAGRIAVYHVDPSNGRYSPVGPDIVGGTPGDSIGYAGSALSGGVGPNGPVVVLATQHGRIQRYDYNPNVNQWEQRYDEVSFPPSDHVSIDFAMGESFDTLVLGLIGEGTNQTLIYQMETQGAAVAPNMTMTGAPSDAPVGSITFAPIPPPTTNIFNTPAPVTTSVPTVPSVVVPASFSPSRSPLTTTLPPVTASPVEMTMSPTTSVVSPPVNTDSLWTVSGGPFASSGSNGTVVALSDTRMLLASGGVVQTFTKQTVSGVLTVWEDSRVADVVQSAVSEFGQAIAITRSSSSGAEMMVVGAPGALVMSTQLASGAVYCYYLDSTANAWTQQGSTLPLSSDGALAGERFGNTVAVSDSTRVAVGAPHHTSEGLTNRGRVYVYEYDASLTDWTLTDQIMGMAAEEQFGSDVDISASFLIVGAPGSGSNQTGAATIYQSSNVNWFVVTTITGDEAHEAMGSAVSMLSPDGDVVAI